MEAYLDVALQILIKFGKVIDISGNFFRSPYKGCCKGTQLLKSLIGENLLKCERKKLQISWEGLMDALILLKCSMTWH